MPVLDVEADFGDAVTEANKLNVALNNIEGGLASLIATTNKYNAEGVMTSGVVKGLTKDGKEFVATLGLMTKAQKEAAGVAEDSNELIRKSIKYTDDAMKNELKTIKEEERAWREFQKVREDAGRKYRQDQADQASFAARLRKEEEDDRKKLLAAIKKQEAEQSRAAKEEENAAKRAALELKKKEEQVGRVEAAFTRLARSAQYFITYRAFSFITSEIEEGVKAANKLQIQLSLIRTITQDKQITFGQLSKDVRGVSDATGFDINTTAEAFYQATSNQVARGRDTAPFVRNVADLARVTGSDLPAAIDLVSTAINAYGRNVNDAELIQAQFFRTIDEGRVVASELGTGLGRVLTIAAPLGIAIEDIEATLALTTQKGLKTADAVTLLTNFLSKLEKPTVETSRFFKQLGFDSFEAAQRVLGFQKTIQLLLTSIEKGDLSTGGTFDELRSRKQLGVFQEAATGIEAFSNKLKDNQTTLAQYRKALEIRGESPADSVNKQLNQAKNAFTESLGQRIVAISDNVLKFAVSTKNAALESRTLGQILTYTLPALGAYAAGVGVMSAANFLFARSSVTATAALATLAKGTVVIAGLAAAYYATETIVNSIKFNPNLGNIDIGSIDSMIEKAKQLKEAAALKDATGGPQIFDFDKSRENGVTAVYKGVGGILAQAKVQNDRLVEATKGKAKETGEALKLGFAGYTNLLQDNLAKTKRAITENRNEIEKSKRALLSFNDSLDTKLFNRQFEYANDEQKIILAEKRAEELKQKAREAFRAGTPEKTDEGRRLYDEAANEFGRAADARQQLFRKQAEASGATYFEYNTREEKAYYDELKRLRAEDEKNLQATAERKIKQDKASEVSQEDSLLRLKNALKDYQETDVFTATGGVRKEFQDDSGKFDQGKFSQSLKSKEAELIKFAGNDLKLQFEVQNLITNHRKALIEEAAAKERAEYLKTLQVQITGDEERFKKQLAAAKNAREEAVKDQIGVSKDLESGSSALGGFGGGILKQFGIVGRNFPTEEVKTKFSELENSIASYRDAIGFLNRDANVVNGVKVFRPEDIANVEKRLKDVLLTLKEFQALTGNENRQPTIVSQGKQLSVNDFADVTRDQLGKASKAGDTIKESFTKEDKLAKEFEQRVFKPMLDLQAKFPELKVAADLATQGIAADFANLAGPGLDPLFIRLQDLQSQMRNLAIPIVGAAGGDWEGGGGDWMAKGGVAGKFPGSPRGQDRYPIWAKKDEYIVNAESSRMFRPMLDAINSRRNPRYMASGGVVGGDTTIGDISVTVNGASTNAGTGQAVVNTLERAIRRGNLRRLRS